MGSQGRRHADEDGVAFTQPAEVGGCIEATGLDEALHLLAAHRRDVAAASQQLDRLGRVDVEADHAEAGPGHRRRQGQADVAQTDDAHRRLAVVEELAEGFEPGLHDYPVMHDLAPWLVKATQLERSARARVGRRRRTPGPQPRGGDGAVLSSRRQPSAGSSSLTWTEGARP